MSLENLTKQQLIDMISAKNKIASSGLMVKITESDKEIKSPTGKLDSNGKQVYEGTGKVWKSKNLYISSPKFEVFTPNKNKMYRASVNMNLEVAKHIFLDDDMLAQIVQEIKALDE